MTELERDESLKQFAATEVMGWNKSAQGWDPVGSDVHAFRLLDAAQRRHPGWRFDLLGGDFYMGLRRTRNGRLTVDTKSRIAFGWKAELHGDADPRKNYGQRHGEARSETRPRAITEAICRAFGWKGPDAAKEAHDAE